MKIGTIVTLCSLPLHYRFLRSRRCASHSNSRSRSRSSRRGESTSKKQGRGSLLVGHTWLVPGAGGVGGVFAPGALTYQQDTDLQPVCAQSWGGGLRPPNRVAKPSCLGTKDMPAAWSVIPPYSDAPYSDEEDVPRATPGVADGGASPGNRHPSSLAGRTRRAHGANKSFHVGHLLATTVRHYHTCFALRSITGNNGDDDSSNTNTTTNSRTSYWVIFKATA